VIEEDSPFIVQEIGNLASSGVPEKCLSFACVSKTGNSGPFVIANRDNNEIYLVDEDLNSRNVLSGHDVSHASLNLDQTCLAISSNTSFQVLNHPNSEIISEIDAKEKIEFINWVTPTDLAIVTKSSYLLWRNGEVKKLRDRLPETKDFQIVDFSINGTGWCSVSGIKPKNGVVCGIVQLFDFRTSTSIVYEGHCGTFLLTNSNKSYFALYSTSSRNSLQLISLPDTKFSTSIEVFISKSNARDFPIQLVSLFDSEMILIIFKSGIVHVYDIGTKVCLIVFSASSCPLFCVYSQSDRVFGLVDRYGGVKRVSINEKSFLDNFKSSIELFDLYQVFESARKVN
jgi:hypothetical protein